VEYAYEELQQMRNLKTSYLKSFELKQMENLEKHFGIK
jgi:hypothetical protein